MHGHEPFDRAEALGLAGEDLVRRPAATRLQHGVALHQVDRLNLQRVIGPMEVVDQEGEGGRIDADQASLDLGLAPNLNGGHERDQQRDQPETDRSGG